MTKDERIMRKAAIISWAVFLLLMLVGCTTTKTVEVEKVRDVYHNTIDTVRDSVYHDVFVDRFIKGDTVYVNKTEYLYRDKWRKAVDTLIVRDTVNSTIQTTIEKKMSFWEKLETGIWWLLVVMVLSLVAWNYVTTNNGRE